MRWLLAIFLVFPIWLTQASDQYSWFADLEPITLNNVNQIQLLAVFMDADKPTLSPDGRYFAFTNSEHRLTVFDTYTGLNRSYVAQGQVVFSPDSSLLAFSDGSSALRILYLADGSIREVFAFTPEDRPYKLWAITSDNTKLIANVHTNEGGEGGCMRAIDLTANPDLPPSRCFKSGEPIILTQDGKYYTFRGFKAVEVRDIDTGELAAEIPYRGSITDIAFWMVTPDVLITNENVRSDANAKLMYHTDILITDLDTFETRRIPTEDHSSKYSALYYDGSKMLTVNQFETCIPVTLRTFNLQSMVEVSALTLNFSNNTSKLYNAVRWTAVNSAATMAVTVNYLKKCNGESFPLHLDSLAFWDIQQGIVAKQIPISGFVPMDFATFSSDNRLVMTSSLSKTVELWGVVPQPHRLPIYDGKFSLSQYYAILPSTLVCRSSPPSLLNVGYTAYVPTTANTDVNNNLRVRKVPNGEQVGSLIAGERVQIVGGPVCDEKGILWWGIQSLANPETSGWSVEAINDSDYILIPE